MANKSPLQYFDDGGAANGPGPAELQAQTPIDLSKVNPAGIIGADQIKDPAIRDQYIASIKAQQDYANSLEQRYAKPNWFQIAAGFAKPQLGGFFASLGSAAQAYGQQVEAQRAVAPTIAKMRAQINAQMIPFMQKGSAQQKYLSNIDPKTGMVTPIGSAESSILSNEAPATTVASQAQATTTPVNVESTKTGIDTQKIERLNTILLGMYQRNGVVPPTTVNQFLLQAGVTPQQFIQAQHKDPFSYSVPSGSDGLASPSVPQTGAPVSASSIKPSTINAKPVSPSYDGNRLGDLGVPVVTTGDKVLTVDPNQMNPAASSFLKSEGWTQDPNDPNKWNLTNPSSNGSYIYDGKLPTTLAKNIYGSMSKTAAEVQENRDLETASNIDTPYQKVYSSLATRVNDPNFVGLKNNYNTALSLLSDPANKSDLSVVGNYIRQNGQLQNQILNVVKEGAAAHAAGHSVSIALPVDAWKQAGFTPRQQMLADLLEKSFLRIAVNSQLSQGLTPAGGQEAFLNNVNNGFANLFLNPATANNILSTDYIKDISYPEKAYNAFTQGLSHVAPDSLTKYADVANHWGPYKDAQHWADLHDAMHQKAYQNYLNKLQGNQ